MVRLDSEKHKKGKAAVAALLREWAASHPNDELAKKAEMQRRVASAVASWRFGKDLLQQLTTLDQIWPTAPPVDRAAIDSDAAVKKLYFKAVRCVHPDKIGEGSRFGQRTLFHRRLV